jgi:hypothetical protein
MKRAAANTALYCQQCYTHKADALVIKNGIAYWEQSVVQVAVGINEHRSTDRKQVLFD